MQKYIIVMVFFVAIYAPEIIAQEEITVTEQAKKLVELGDKPAAIALLEQHYNSESDFRDRARSINSAMHYHYELKQFDKMHETAELVIERDQNDYSVETFQKRTQSSGYLALYWMEYRNDKATARPYIKLCSKYEGLNKFLNDWCDGHMRQIKNELTAKLNANVKANGLINIVVFLGMIAALLYFGGRLLWQRKAN